MLGLPEWKLGHIRYFNQNTSNKGNKDAGNIIVEQFHELANVSEFELYWKVFGEVVKLTVTESNRYANWDKNKPSFHLTNENFGIFCDYFYLQVIIFELENETIGVNPPIQNAKFSLRL